MSDLEEKAISILDKLESLTTQYAPDVVDAAIKTIQISGIGTILSCVIMGLIIYLMYVGNKKMVPIWRKKYEDDRDSDWDVAAFVVPLISSVVSLVLLIIIFENLSNIWVWTSIFNPKLALAHKLLGL